MCCARFTPDPDIIMVGEIRDGDTAEIAIKAAQTGHLVLSTLHTNSTSETLIRLQQMGVARWMISSALTLVVAQRPVRKLCPHCKQRLSDPVVLSPNLLAQRATALAGKRLSALLPRLLWPNRVIRSVNRYPGITSVNCERRIGASTGSPPPTDRYRDAF